MLAATPSILQAETGLAALSTRRATERRPQHLLGRKSTTVVRLRSSGSGRVPAHGITQAKPRAFPEGHNEAVREGLVIASGTDSPHK